MRNKAIGILALIVLAALVLGTIFGLPLWAWGVVFALGLILWAVERAWTRRHGSSSTSGTGSQTDRV
jgi:hypothetical protein